MHVVEQQDDRLPGSRCGEKVMHLGEELAGTLCGGMESAGQSREIGSGRELCAGFAPRAIRGCLREIITAPDEDERTLFARLAAESLSEGGLADTGLAAEQDEATSPGEGCGEFM